MINFSLKDIIKNILIVMPYVRKISSRSHVTGIMNDNEKIENRVKELTDLSNTLLFDEIVVMEIGPGRNSDTILGFSKLDYVKKSYVNDIFNYFSDNFWLKNGVDYSSGDLAERDSNSVNFIYMYDVLEHVKSPKYFLEEVRRILKKGGTLFVSWDLRDHFFYMMKGAGLICTNTMILSGTVKCSIEALMLTGYS